MRRLIAVGVILILIISFCFFSSYIVTQKTDTVRKLLDNSIELFNNENYDLCTHKLQQLENYWIDTESIMIQLVNRQRLEEIGEKLAVAKAFAKEKDEAEFSAACEEIKIMLSHLTKEEGFII